MFADIGIGIFMAIATANLFAVPLDARLILAGVLFVLLPDIDAVFHVAAGKRMRSKFSHEHRNVLHYPIVYPVLGALVAVFWGPLVACMFVAGAVAHFMHDSIGIGWGVKWLWPFSKRNFTLYQVDTYTWFFWKTDREVWEIADRYGKDDWIRYYYFRPTVISIVEGSIFLGALIALWMAW